MPAAHPPEFRRRASDLVAQGNPVGQTARDLGISESFLRNWMDRNAVDSGRKRGVTTDEHEELVELRRRNRVLEMEIDNLERASAYFARKTCSQNRVSVGPGARR
ncbi:transposase [Microbacterium sp. NPDC016588]